MIEFQFFDGCPNADNTLKNLCEAMVEQHITRDHLKITEIPDIESAKMVDFQGSPTILVNGKDLYTDEEPVDFSYSCRIYMFNGEQTGCIPKEIIAAKLNNFHGDLLSQL
jgi:hypothetical protein